MIIRIIIIIIIIIIITITTIIIINCGTNQYKQTGPSPIKSQTLQYAIMKREHVC
jgi:hypothetical protein